MSGRGDDGTSPDHERGAPVDLDQLDVIEERLAGDARFSRIERQSGFVPDRIVAEYESGFYPETVSEGRLEVVWFENGNFSLHYHEGHDEGRFDHRWDRHPSDHNARDHVHPGPDAPTPGEDVSHPADWRDVLSMALAEIEDRQRAFWSD